MNRFLALCTGLVLVAAASAPAAAQTHFVDCGIEDGNINNATIVVPTASTPDINGSPLTAGSEIAVFKAGTDQCAGAQVWNDANTTVTVWGDDDQTGQIEGLVAGDSMVFRIWDAVSGLEFSEDAVEIAYDPNSGLNSSGRYTHDGLYVLSSLSVVDESLQAPDAPTLLSPGHEAADVSRQTDLEWRASQDATTYHVQVDVDAQFDGLVFEASGFADTTATVNGLEYFTTYYWRVRATGDGGSGDWSAVRSFTTAAPPPPAAPALSMPENDATNVSENAVLEWLTAEHAETYDVQVDDNPDFSSPEYATSDGADTTATTTGLSNDTQYQWRVRAVGAGGTGPWSEVRSFLTVGPSAPAAPGLVSPDDDAIDTTLDIELDWNGVVGGDTYQVQLDDDPAFGSPELDESGLTATSTAVSGLQTARTYHWRVRAVGPGGSSPWSVVHSFTTAQEEAPGAPALASPANGAGNLALNVALVWTSVDRADSYRLQVDDHDDFSSPRTDEAGLTTTTHAVGGLDFMTTYHWRVRATGGGGDGVWSAPRSFTTLLPPPPDTPAPLLPADGQSGVSVSASIDWSTVEGADSYDLQIHTDDGFESPFRDFQGLDVTAKIASGLDPITEYFWRVRSRGPGGASAWSDVRTFTTEQIAEMEAPTLVSPENEMPGVPKQATLTWSVITDAQLYHVQVDDDAAFISPDFENNTLTVTSTITSMLSASTHYYWRVRGSGVEGNGPWSEARRFLTQPDPPELLAPAMDASGVSTNTVFTWAPAPGADRYFFQLDDDPDFSSPAFDINGIGLLSVETPGLEANRTYYWRVRASKNTGMGAWSDVRSFMTGLIQAPSAPITTTPTNGAVDISTTVILEWTRPPGAQSYRWQLDDDPAFGSPMIFAQNHQGNSAAVPGLDYLKTYYWRVQAVNEGGSSFWSDAASFQTIQITPPATPTITSPFYGQQNVDARPTLTWSASARSTAYEVQVDDTFGFASPEFHSDNISATAVIASGLRSETFYYWRVRGVNKGGVSPWSTTGFFTTEYLPIPSSPALVHPSNEAVGFTTSVLLDWSVVDGAYGYHLQVDDDPEFASPVVDDDQVPSRSIEVTGLAPNTSYTWRVRATNPAGYSNWSDARSFRTAPGAPAMLSPLDGSMDVRVDQPFEWDPSDGATAYRVQIAGESTFNDPVIDLESPERSFAFGELVLDDNREYWWRVRAVSESGQSDWADPFRFTTGAFLTVAIEDDDHLPQNVRLDPAYPNPFSRTTTFKLHLPASSNVVMKMFDMLGREVGHLVDDRMPAGTHRIEWAPDRLSSGVYVAFVVVEGRSMSRMVTLAR